MKSKILSILKWGGALFLTVLLVALSLRAYFLTPKIWLKSIAQEQTFDMAVHISAHPSEKKTYIVTAKEGRIFKFSEDSYKKTLLLDLSEKVQSRTTEEGMLSAVIDPQNTDTIYVYYCLKVKPLTNRLVRFKMDENNIIDPKSEEVLLQFTKPKTGHNGGQMYFHSDGYLWLGVGEAGFSGTKQGDVLDTHIAGTIIRIDVRNPSEDKAYSIPSDNPFVGNKENIPEEVWAMGFRNHWRWSFLDKDTVIAGDVGNRTYEEIVVAKKGDHLGWPYMEGPGCTKFYKKCDKSKYKLPMSYFSREVSRSITGGYVYHGNQVEYLKGKYVFADYLRGVMTIDLNNKPYFVKNLWTSGFELIFPKLPMTFGPDKGYTIHPVSFFEDENKELLIVALNGGIFRIVPIDLWTQVRSFFYLFGSFR